MCYTCEGIQNAVSCQWQMWGGLQISVGFLGTASQLRILPGDTQTIPNFSLPSSWTQCTDCRFDSFRTQSSFFFLLVALVLVAFGFERRRSVQYHSSVTAQSRSCCKVWNCILNRFQLVFVVLIELQYFIVCSSRYREHPRTTFHESATV